MSFFLSLLRWELRFQLTSLRSKATVLLYVVFCLSAPVYVFVRGLQATSPEHFRLLGHLLEVQPFLTLCLTILVSGHRAGGDALPEMTAALVSAPIGNAGYLLCRWTALVAMLVPVTAVPFLVTLGLAAASGWDGYGLEGWTWAWALRVLPLVAVGCAAWLGAVTIFAHELAAFGATVLGSLLFLNVLNQALFHFRLHVDGLADWIGLVDLNRWLEGLRRITPLVERRLHYLPDTDAPFDARMAWEWTAAQAAVPLGLAVALLGAGAVYVRRSRRDVRPYRVRPDHPLRTYLLLLFRLREHLTPVAGLSRTDRLAVVLGLALLVACLGFVLERQRHYRGLAEARYQAETEDFPTLPWEIEPSSWRIHGAIATDGSVGLDVEGTLHHRGSEPQGHLAFSLDEHLEIRELGVRGRRTSISRAWDRVRVSVDPPFLPGENLELHGRIGGVPGRVDFPFRYPGRKSFITQLDTFRTVDLPRDLVDLSRSRFDRAVSPQRVELRAPQLGLLPRYLPWTLTPFSNFMGESGLQVSGEEILHAVDLEVAIDVPARWFVADPCGHTSGRADASRLEGRCRTVLADYGVFGGEYELLGGEPVTLAVLPPHLEQARRFSESIVPAMRLTARAWPGLEGVKGLTVMEWPQRLDFDPLTFGPFELHGQLLLVTEFGLTHGFIPNPEFLAAQVLARDLIARRAVDKEQGLFLRRFLQTLLLHRMGISRQKDAVIGTKDWGIAQLQEPILTAKPWAATLWFTRLPAVQADLIGRLGMKTIVDGVERFLSAGPEPGTFEELVAALEEVSGVSLQRFAGDFLTGTAVPLLELDGVESERDAAGFRVSGLLRNTGTGEVICPILVKTEVSEGQVLVTVDSESETPFELRTKSKPVFLHLDPLRTCHRVITSAPAAMLERVDLSSAW